MKAVVIVISIVMTTVPVLVAGAVATWRRWSSAMQPERPIRLGDWRTYDGVGDLMETWEENVARVTVNHGAIDRMLGEIQNRINQHPIVIPMQADPSAALPNVTHVTIQGPNSGPIITGNQSVATVGVSTAVSTPPVGAVDPVRARTAEIVAEVLRLLPDFDLPEPDRELAEEAGREVLAEISSPSSDDSTIRKAFVRVKGAVAQVAMKVLMSSAEAGTDEAGKATRAALEALIHHTF